MAKEQEYFEVSVCPENFVLPPATNCTFVLFCVYLFIFFFSVSKKI